MFIKQDANYNPYAKIEYTFKNLKISQIKPK